MSMQLQYREDFVQGIKRLLVEQSEDALQQLRSAKTEAAQHKAVHEVRRSFKKIRAGLRLIRDVVPFYKEVNVYYRDQARRISLVRDATANLEVFDLLEKRYSDGLKDQSLAPIRQLLLEHQQSLAVEVFQQNDTLHSMAYELEAQINFIRDWDFKVKGFSAIRPGIQRVYERGRKAMQKAHSKGKEKDWHEWRKRIKYLRYQIDILHRIWPGMMTSLETELHTLSDLTGTDHDLHVLQHTLTELDEEMLQQANGILLHALIEKQQDLLQTHAYLLGRRVYHLPPKAFSGQLGGYWKMYQREIERKALPELESLRV
jgi:CHAD domain-containing protein